MINIYRILESTQGGMLKSRSQYDRVRGEMKSFKQHRNEVLKEILQEINQLRSKGVKGIIATGDMNEDIVSK